MLGDGEQQILLPRQGHSGMQSSFSPTHPLSIPSSDVMEAGWEQRGTKQECGLLKVEEITAALSAAKSVQSFF